MSPWAEQAKFWRTIPPLSTAIFLAAVFCVFAAVGFLSMGVNLDMTSPRQIILAVIISGGFAVGYALVATRQIPKLLLILIPAHIAAISSLSLLDQHPAAVINIPQALQVKILLGNIGGMVLVVGGYVLFLFFSARGQTVFQGLHGNQAGQ